MSDEAPSTLSILDAIRKHCEGIDEGLTVIQRRVSMDEEKHRPRMRYLARSIDALVELQMELRQLRDSL